MISAIAFTLSAFAQTETSVAKLHFGFNLGFNYSNLQATKSNLSAAEVRTENNLGIRMGIITEYEMGKHFSFSQKTEMAFNDGKVSLHKSGDEYETYNIVPVTIELPTHFQYKFKAEKSSPYVLFGVCYKLAFIDEKNPPLEMTKTTDVALDLGIGFNRIFPSFNFAPELRYSYGLMNLSSVDAISNLKMHSVSLLFNFKG